MAITYQITQCARRDQEKNLETVREASEVLGLTESDLWIQAEDNKGSYENPELILNQLFRDLVHNQSLDNNEISPKDLSDIFSEEEIDILVENNYLEKIDPDEDLILTLEEAFSNFGELFDIEYLKSKAPEFSEKTKDRVLVEDSKGNDDRDYPSFLHIRGIVLHELNVILARKITITDE